MEELRRMREDDEGKKKKEGFAVNSTYKSTDPLSSLCSKFSTKKKKI